VGPIGPANNKVIKAALADNTTLSPRCLLPLEGGKVDYTPGWRPPRTPQRGENPVEVICLEYPPHRPP